MSAETTTLRPGTCIFDHHPLPVGGNPPGLTTCECHHKKQWIEGDYFEPKGYACAECIRGRCEYGVNTEVVAEYN